MAWLRAEMGGIGRALRAWPLYVLVLGALFAWGAAWQVRPPQEIDLGGRDDDAYVRQGHTGELAGPSSFYAKEPVDPPTSPPFTYRWSKDHSEIAIPGADTGPLTVTLRLAGGRPASTGLLPPIITATVRGQAFVLPTAADLQDYPLLVPRDPTGRGDLLITLDSPTFRPPGDGRDLGVLVDRVTLEPTGGGAVVPPLGQMAAWLAALVLLYLIGYRLGGVGGATLGGVVGMGGVALGLLFARPAFSLLAPDASALLLWAFVLLVAGTALTRLLLPSLAPRAAQWVGAAFAFAFVLRFGGMVYPQFLSSDLTFQMHRLGFVLDGVWVFAGELPNGTIVPYPPLAYALLAPLHLLTPDLALILRWGGSLLDASVVFPLAIIAYRLIPSPPAARRPVPVAVLAAWAYALLPAALVYFSAGNYSNLIAQAVFSWALAAWVAGLLGRAVGPWLLFAGGLILTFLGHYGMLIAAAGLVVAAAIPPLLTGPGVARRQAGATLAALAGALGLAFLLYYGRWLPEIGAQAAQVLAGGGRTTFDLGLLLTRTVRRLGTEWSGVLGLAGVTGGLLLIGAQRGTVRRRLVAGWLGGAALVGLGFAALDQTVGDSIRYPLLLAPWVALGAGTMGGLLARRGQAGPVFVALAGAVALGHLLQIWLPLVLTAYH